MKRGLGKTVSLLALIVENTCERFTYEEKVVLLKFYEAGDGGDQEITQRPDRAMLH